MDNVKRTAGRFSSSSAFSRVPHSFDGTGWVAPFKDGTEYRVEVLVGDPEALFEAHIGAESLGKYFNTAIRNNHYAYRVTKL